MREEPFRRRREPNVPEEIAVLRDQADKALRELEDALARHDLQRKCAIGVHFPRGYLREVEHFTKSKWDFISRRERAKAMAYRAQHIDFLQWLINRLDIDLTVLEGTLFWGVVLVASICEALCLDCVNCIAKEKGLKGPGISLGLKGMVDFLRNASAIDEALAEDIDWIRRVRNDIHEHVFSKKWEATGRPSYKVEDFNRAVQLCDTLTETLRRHYAADPV